MHPSRTHARYWLLAILVLNVLSTAIHYFDNYVSFERYPMPVWITQDAVWKSWLVLTAIGGIGYWFYWQRQFLLAYLGLVIYSATGASTLGHYFYAPLSHFSAQMNAMIWSDGIVGFLLVAFLLWSILIDQPWKASALSS